MMALNIHAMEYLDGVFGQESPQCDISDEDDKIQNNHEERSEFWKYESELTKRSHALAQNVKTKAEQFVQTVREKSWVVCKFNSLPKWLQDNEYLIGSHRPQLASFKECFQSIFRIHTETINIWTHLLGCVLYIALACYFMSLSKVPLEAKLVLSAFFASIIFCLSTSCVFHTVCCHSEPVVKLFGKLDYCGISFLIMGSCTSWIYYGFYSKVYVFVLYITVVMIAGSAIIVVSWYDGMNGSESRHYRTFLFACFGLSSGVPAVHYTIENGFLKAFFEDSVSWVCLSGVLYLLGAAVYTYRIPERFFPGWCDVWFHSHGIFHCLVVFAAYTHYVALQNMALSCVKRITY